MCKYLARGMTAATLAVVLTGIAAAADPPGPSAPVDPNDYTETPALWTCGAQDWGPWTARCVGTDDRPAAGQWAVLMNFESTPEHYFAFPKWRNAKWDLSQAESLVFRVKLPKGVSCGAAPIVYLRDQDGPFLRISPKEPRSLLAKESDGQWQSIRIPLKEDPRFSIFRWMNPSLAKIDFFEVAFDWPNTPKHAAHWVQIDDVRFEGGSPVTYAPPNEEAADLDVLLIERSPMYERYHLKEYDGIDLAVCDNRESKHYPAQGEQVTFTARIQNKGRAPLGGKFAWTLDGKRIGEGEVATLKPRERAEFATKWGVGFRRSRPDFQADTRRRRLLSQEQ